MSRTRKILLWRNMTPLGTGPRWDAEIVLEDGSRRRIVNIKLETALEFVREAMVSTMSPQELY